ncbi:MAG: hypothetical protein WAM74_23635 [Xanthobacteraceae bacterium]
MASEKKDSIVSGDIDGSMDIPGALVREAIAEDAAARYEMIKERLMHVNSGFCANRLSP